MYSLPIINIALVLGFLLANVARGSHTAYGPAPQAGAQRDGDLIRTLYEGNPAARLAPFEPGDLAEPNRSSAAPDQTPPAWSRLAFESFRYDKE